MAKLSLERQQPRQIILDATTKQNGA